jgi:hypothetical protein
MATHAAAVKLKAERQAAARAEAARQTAARNAAMFAAMNAH